MNKFFVASHGDDVVFLKIIPQRLSRDDALLLAAWLIAIADPGLSKHSEVLKAVLET